MKTALLLLLAASAALGQSGNRAAIRTSGQYEPDGSVIYSVYVASGQEELGEVTITAALPAGTRYLESVQKPLDGVYEGVKSDTVWWKIGKLERDTLVGPFVFRVKLDGTTREVPATIQAAVAYERPVAELVESPAPSGTLAPLANRGSIVIDQRGTLDSSGRNAPVTVGETGIVVFIPEGAVTERVTLTFNRLNVGENKLPATDPPTWWCSLYQTTSEPQVRFSQSISVAFPARRGLTPGIETSLFTTNDLENWQKAVGPATEQKEVGRGIGFGCVGLNCGFAGGCVSQFGHTTCRFGVGFGFGQFGGFGYIEQDNARGTTGGPKLGVPAIGTLLNPPSIIAILIGARP